MNVAKKVISSAIMAAVITVIIWVGSFVTSFFGLTAMLAIEEYLYVVFPGAFVGLFIMDLLNFAKLR